MTTTIRSYSDLSERNQHKTDPAKGHHRSVSDVEYMKRQAASGKRPLATIKLLMIGNSGVGKSALLTRFADDHYAPSFIPTIGIDFRVREVAVEGARLRLQVWDTAGQERFKTITKAYYRGAQGVALVYDVTDPSSFHAISSWVRSLEQHGSSNVCRIIVANKSDQLSKRAISLEEGQALADKYGFKHIETSAKTGDNVEDLFMTLAKEVKRRLLDPIMAQDGDTLETLDEKEERRRREQGIVDFPPRKPNIFTSCCQS